EAVEFGNQAIRNSFGRLLQLVQRPALVCKRLGRTEECDVGRRLSNLELRVSRLCVVFSAAIAIAQLQHIPEEGAFIGFKKCQGGVIVKLLIPEDAKRSHGTERKCRASKAVVLDVFGAEEGISIHDGKQSMSREKR